MDELPLTVCESEACSHVIEHRELAVQASSSASTSSLLKVDTTQLMHKEQ